MPPAQPTPLDPAPAAYLAQGPFTDPRDLASRLQRLAARGAGDPAALAEVVRSVMIHVFWRRAHQLEEDPARSAAETNLRDVRAKLERLGELQASLGRSPDDVGPLPAPQKLIGNCRDHSVLYVALLRLAGFPARARCGFARYFESGKWIDHWVVERWDGRRWVVTDAQLDRVMKEALEIRFDPMDLPPGEFVSGGEAWLACQAGDDPRRYGIFQLRGWDFVKGNLVRDVCALAGRELLPWDCWGRALEPRAGMPAETLAALDEAAQATPMRVQLPAGAAAALADRPGFRLPRRIVSFARGEPEEVDLGPVLDGWGTEPRPVAG